MIKAIMFSMEPTIVDASQKQVDAYNGAFERYGHNRRITLGEYKPFYGQKGDNIMRQLLGKTEIDDEVRKLVELKQESYESTGYTEDNAKIAPGALKLIGAINKINRPIYIVSSGKAYVANSLIDHVGIRDKIHAIVDGGGVTKGKPDPEIYYKALDVAGVLPENCLAFEGALPGVMSATDAGIPCIAVVGDNPRDPFENKNPYMIIGSLEELFPKKFYEILDDFEKEKPRIS